MHKNNLIPGKRYHFCLSSISYLKGRADEPEFQIPFGTIVTFLKDDWGFWFKLDTGEEAMVADAERFAEVTDESKALISAINEKMLDLKKVKEELHVLDEQFELLNS